MIFSTNKDLLPNKKKKKKDKSTLVLAVREKNKESGGVGNEIAGV